MGFSSSKNSNKTKTKMKFENCEIQSDVTNDFNKNSIMEKKNETFFEQYPLNEKNRYENKISPSICKLEIKINEREIVKGTGFLIKLNIDNNEYKYFLVTNEHVIKREYIEEKKLIDIKYDNTFENISIKLDRYERILNTYENIIDLTIIEILQKDNINEAYFLLPNYEYNGEKNNQIYIYHNIQLKKDILINNGLHIAQLLI